MKQQEAERVSKFALKKKAKSWGVAEFGKYLFTGRYHQCYAFVVKRFPGVQPEDMIVRRAN